jgi:hypothetical protein
MTEWERVCPGINDRIANLLTEIEDEKRKQPEAEAPAISVFDFQDMFRNDRDEVMASHCKATWYGSESDDGVDEQLPTDDELDALFEHIAAEPNVFVYGDATDAQIIAKLKNFYADELEERRKELAEDEEAEVSHESR